MISNPHQKYQQSSIQTASPGQLLLMLYDGAIRFVKLGIEGIEENNIEKKNNNLIKAQKIINELIASLNFDYTISTNLIAIYEYMIYQLIQANIKNDQQFAIEILQYLIEMKESWQQLMKSPIDSNNQTNYG